MRDARRRFDPIINLVRRIDRCVFPTTAGVCPETEPTIDAKSFLENFVDLKRIQRKHKLIMQKIQNQNCNVASHNRIWRFPDYRLWDV